jgi:hypothetical protein
MSGRDRWGLHSSNQRQRQNGDSNEGNATAGKFYQGILTPNQTGYGLFSVRQSGRTHKRPLVSMHENWTGNQRLALHLVKRRLNLFN